MILRDAVELHRKDAQSGRPCPVWPNLAPCMLPPCSHPGRSHALRMSLSTQAYNHWALRQIFKRTILQSLGSQAGTAQHRWVRQDVGL